MREPELFSAGDTLIFERSLDNYTIADGWALTYVLTDLTGKKVAAVVSVADGDYHKIYQQNFAAGLDEGDYIFSGEAINAVSGDKRSIYVGVLTLGADLTDGTASQSQKTDAQVMIETLRDTLTNLYKSKFSETDVNRSRFVSQKLSEALEAYKYWKEVRMSELRSLRALQGHPTGERVQPILKVF